MLAISFTVTCESQAQVDRYWDELTRDGRKLDLDAIRAAADGVGV